MNDRCFGLGNEGNLFTTVVLCIALTGLFTAHVVVVAQIPAAPQPSTAVAAVPLKDAQALIDAGKFSEAADVLRRYVQTEQASAAGHEMLAYADLRLGDAKDSLEEYTRAAAIAQPSAIDLQNVAKDYVLLGDTADAEHWAVVAVRMDEHDPEGWYVLGRVRFTMQRFQDAVDCFQRSLALSPKSVKAENNLGLSYEGLNRTDDAVASYRKAIEWQKAAKHRSEQPLLNLGIILVHQENLTEAKGLLTQAVEIAPRDPRIREQLGHLYLQQKMLEDAEKQFEAAIALEPKKPELHFLLGKVLHEEGQEQKAKTEFAKSAELSGYRATPED